MPSSPTRVLKLPWPLVRSALNATTAKLYIPAMPPAPKSPAVCPASAAAADALLRRGQQKRRSACATYHHRHQSYPGRKSGPHQQQIKQYRHGNGEIARRAQTDAARIRRVRVSPRHAEYGRVNRGRRSREPPNPLFARQNHYGCRRRFSASVCRRVGNAARSLSPPTSSLMAISVSRFRMRARRSPPKSTSMVLGSRSS